MPSWQGVREFVAVAETNSFTKAAERLQTSTANISRQISLLEVRLSVRLFFRTTRKVSLTEDGEFYYQDCKRVLEGLREAENNITQRNEVPSGPIKLTAPVTYGEKILMPIILDFMTQYPLIHVEVELTNIQLDLVHSGCDFALRLGQLADSSMVCRRLATRKLIVCASQMYLEQYGTPHTLAELANFNCLRGQHDYWRFRESGKVRNIRVKGNFRCNSGVSLLDAAKRGLGLIQLPDYYVMDALNSGQLIRVLSHYQDMEEGIWALFPHHRLQPLRVQLLLEYLGAHLSDQ